MKALAKRLSRLEESHAAQRNKQGLTPVDVLRQRMCRRQAAETGRPYEQLLREHIAESESFWKGYDGDGSIRDILRFRFRHRATITLES